MALCLFTAISIAALVAEPNIRFAFTTPFPGRVSAPGKPHRPPLRDTDGDPGPWLPGIRFIFRKAVKYMT